MKAIPAPKPRALSDALEEGEVSLGKSGDVLMVPKDQAQDATTVAIFEPAIITAPKGMKPGMYLLDETEHDELGMVVYPDGTAQIMRPTFISPVTFQELVETGYEPQAIIFNADGTFTVLINDKFYIVKPLFGIKIRKLAVGETVPNIKIRGVLLIYTALMDDNEQRLKKRQTRDGTDVVDIKAMILSECSNFGCCKGMCITEFGCNDMAQPDKNDCKNNCHNACQAEF